MQAKPEIILTRATDHSLSCDTSRKKYSLLIVFEQKAIFAALEECEYLAKKVMKILIYLPSLEKDGRKAGLLDI